MESRRNNFSCTCTVRFPKTPQGLQDLSLSRVVAISIVSVDVYAHDNPLFICL